MKQFKRAIALLLVLVLVLSVFPSAMAAGTDDVPQGVLEPNNFPAEYGNLYIQWNRLSNAQYYTVQLYKHQGEGEQYVLLYSETLTASQVTTSPYKLDVTDWIKSYGPGDYMASIVVERRFSEPEKKSIDLTIEQLAAPTGVSVSTDGEVTWKQVTGNHGYEVQVTVGGQTQTYKVDKGVTTVDASEFIQSFAGSAEAQTVSASVKAYGNLDNGYWTVDSAFSAPAGTLPEQVGVLPTPKIAKSKVVSEDGKLYVEYKLEGGSVGKEYIDSLTLTLENTVVKAQTYTTTSVDTTGRIEVTYLNDGTTTLPEGTYDAVITANPKYPDLNAPASSEGTVTYGVDPLDAPVLTVSDDASMLSWPAVELSQGTLDSTADYKVQYKEHSEEDWVTVSIRDGNAIQQDGETFYVDLTSLIKAGTLYDFKVIANNNEDLTLGKTSSASIQIFKTVVPTGVKIEARDNEDKVFAAWTAPTTTEGIDHYRVDVYMDDVLKTSLTTTGVVNKLDISSAIDEANENEYTVQVTAIGKHLVNGVFYGDSAVSEESNSVTSGTVAAPVIEFETRAGASTSYYVYFAGKAATSLPANVEGYNVTITYVLASGATNTWTGVINDVKCDIAQLKNQNGSQFMTTSWGDYANAEFTVKAVALSTNTALHANSAEVNGEDIFELSDIGLELDIQVKTENGRTVVSWNEIPGASYYFYTVQKVGEKNFVGTVQVTEADITDYLTSAGQWIVTVNALAQDGSTVYVNGNKDIMLTVLAAPAVTIKTDGDTATAKWDAITDAENYLVTVKLGDEVLVDAVTVTDTSYSLTELIKEKGPGTYTVEVTAVGDGSEYITSLEPGKATIEITKLTAPGVTFALNTAGRPTVTIAAKPGETVESYTVYLYANDQLVETLTGKQAGNINVSTYINRYKTAEKAVTFKAEVEAVGSLHHNTLTSDKETATLNEKVGSMPAPTITTSEITQSGGRLMVSYKLDNNGVPLSQIARLELVLKYQVGSATSEITVPVTDVAWSGSIDVSDANLPAGEIEATLNVVPKYALINTLSTTTETLTYNVETLPAPKLTVSDDGYTLSWSAIEMSNGAAVDQIDEFAFEYKKAGDANWTTVNTGDPVIVKNADGTFSVDLKPFLAGGNHLFRVTAYNGKDGVREDPTFTASSNAEVTVEKLADVTNVTFTRDDPNDAVVASWTDSNTAGVAGYQVEVLKVLAGDYEVVKSETVTGTTSYTVPAGVIDNVNQYTYTVRVKALGTKSYEGTFYADAEFVTSTNTLTSGQLPTPDATSVAQEGSTLKLTVNLLDVNNNVGEIESIYLTKLTKGGISYSGRVAGTITGTTAVFDIFELTEGSLSDGTWTATIEVVSKNTTLFNGGTYDDVTVQYGAQSLRVTDLTVDTKTGEISWSSVENADGYDVIVSYGLGNDWSARLLDDGSELKYTITGPDGEPIVPGTTYTVKVRPYSNNAIQYPTDPDLATVKLCKLVAPTETTVTIDDSSAYLNWTKSTSPVGGIANYLVTAGTYSKTAGANATKLSIRAAGLLNSAAEDGTYTLTLQAIGKQATNGIYYVDSDVVTHSESVYKGKIPVADLAAPNTAMTESFQLRWVAGGTLQFSFKLPASDDTEYGDKLIAAIDTANIKVRAYQGSDLVGEYGVAYDQATGTYVADVTRTTVTDSDVAWGLISNVENLKFRVYLPTNYSLIAANTTAAKAMQVPDKGAISYDNLTVDYTTGDFSFDVIDGVQYTITIREKDSSTYTELTVDADGKVSLGSYTLTAGTTYEVQISAKDTNQILTDSQTSFYLYRPTDPTGITIANSTGVMNYTVDKNYPSKTVVEYDEKLASYDEDTKTFTFNVTETVQTLKVTLKTEGLYDEDTNTYVLNASNTASRSVNFGMVPAFTMTPEAIVLQGSGETTVTYQVDSTSKMKSAADWTNATVVAESSKGTANGVVTPDSAAGTIVATFDKGQLLEGVAYTFTLTVPKKAAYNAVSADRVVVSEPLSYSTSDVTFDASVSETGYLSLTNVDEKIELFYMSINDSTTKYEVYDNFRLTSNSEFNNALKSGQVKLTITADPKDESVNAKTVTLYVERLQTVTVELDKKGEIVVTDPNKGMGTYSVVVIGNTDNDKVTYTDTVIAEDPNYGDDWKDDTWQTLTYTTTTTGGYENNVYYLNATAVDNHITDFYVGVLPELVLTPSDNGALAENAEGDIVIAYAAAEADQYDSIGVKINTVEAPYNVVLDTSIDDVVENGTFKANAVKSYANKALTTTFTLTPAFDAINTQRVQTVTYTYAPNVLVLSGVKVDHATGVISWDANPNAAYYEVKYGTTTQDVLDVTSFNASDLVTAGEPAMEFSITAIAANPAMYNDSDPVTVSLYRLENPTNAKINNTTGVLTYEWDNSYGLVPEVTTNTDLTTYDAQTMTLTFDKTAVAYQTTVTVKGVGGHVKSDDVDVWVLDADTTATVRQWAGQVDDFAMEPASIELLPDGSTQVTFVRQTKTALSNYINWNGIKVTAVGDGDTITGNVTASNTNGTVVANFADKKLQENTPYTFTLTVPVNANRAAVAGPREVVVQDLTYSTSEVTFNANVTAAGILELTEVDPKIASFTMKVNDSDNGFNVYNGFDLLTNNEFKTAIAKGQVKLTITANPEDSSVSAKTVTMQVERLKAVTVTLLNTGLFRVSDPNNGKGTYTTVVTGSVSGEETYVDKQTGDNYGDDWKEGAWQTLTAVTTTTGGLDTENGVYYLNATSEKTAKTTFYVGQLPALTLDPASGNLTKDADGKVLIGYTVPVAESYASFHVKIATVTGSYEVAMDDDVSDVAKNGTIDATDVEKYTEQLQATITSTPAYSGINTGNTQTTTYTYNSNVLATPVLSFDNATGIIRWTAVDNAKDYTLTYNGTDTTTITGTSFDPADYGVVAGTAVEFNLVANPDNTAQYVKSGDVTFTVYQLQNPISASVNAKTGVLTFTGDAKALTEGYPFDTKVQVGGDDYSGSCTEVDYDSSTGKGTATVTFDVDAEVAIVPVTVTLTGKVDAESNVYVIDAAKSITVNNRQAGKLPEVTAKDLVQNSDGSTTVTFQLPTVANAVYNYYDWTKTLVQAFGDDTYSDLEYSYAGTTYNATDKTISITFPDGLQAASNYYFRVTLYVKPNYEAVAGTEVVYNAGSLSTAMETLTLSGSYGLDGKVTLTPDANATSIVMSWVKDGTTSTKEYSISDSTVVVDPLVDAAIPATDTTKYTFTFVAKANGYADSNPYTIELAYTSAPVIDTGSDGNFIIQVPAGYQLVASVDGGSYQLVDTPNDIGAFLAKVYAKAGATVKVDFKFVSKIATFSTDSVEVNVLTITVSKLADPTISISENNDGTFTVTNENATGTLVVKVDGAEVTAGENGVYTASVEYGEYTVTAVVEGEDYNAEAGTWTFSSETVKAYGNKLGAQLATPTNLKVTASSGQITWNAVENATGYEVQVGDAEPVTVTETKCTPTLAVGENTVTITAVTTDPAYSNSEAASVVLTKLPNLTGLTIGENGEVDMTHDSEITNPYANTTVTVKVTPATGYSDAWNDDNKVVDFDTDADLHNVTIRVSIAGKTYTNESKEKVYLIRPDTFSQTIKVQAGKMPSFTLEDVTTDGVNQTVVTFVTESTEDLSAILDTEVVKNNFEYKYKLSGFEQTWDKKPSAVTIDGNKLIVTLNTWTSTDGYKLTYTFKASPVSSMAGYRGTVTSTDSITFNGNKLDMPDNLRVEMVDGTAYLMWDEVDGATGYTVTKNGHDASGDKFTATQYSLNFSSNNAVTYKVIATADGHSNSEAAVTYVDKVTADEASLSFNATTPVNYSTLRVNTTLEGNGTDGATLNNLKTLLNFYSEDENVTVDKTGTNAYTVSFAEDYLDEQHTYSLKGYILGKYNGVWYYSTAVATSSDVTVGKLAKNASVSGEVKVTGKAQNVTVSLEDVLRTQVKTASTKVTVTNSQGETVLQSVGLSINTAGNMVLKFQAEQLEVGETYTVNISLTPKYESSCTAVDLTCTFIPIAAD